MFRRAAAWNSAGPGRDHSNAHGTRSPRPARPQGDDRQPEARAGVKVKPAPPPVNMFPRCAPNMASRQRSANGSSVARQPIAADGRFMSNGSCPPNATTSARTSVRRRTRATAAASKPGRTQHNPRAQAPSQQNNARRRARFKKPGRNVGKSLPEHKKPRLPVVPISIPIGRNVWLRHTENSREKTGARGETGRPRTGPRPSAKVFDWSSLAKTP